MVEHRTLQILITSSETVLFPDVRNMRRQDVSVPEPLADFAGTTLHSEIRLGRE
jgi:hypothetical protein